MDLLFEFEDKSWFPSGLRRMQMEFIGWMVATLKIYAPLLPVLRKMIKPEDTLHDLCSGSAYPVLNLYAQLGYKVNRLILSDLYPQSLNSQKLEEPIQIMPFAVDVLDIEVNPEVVYSMFNAFHHFNEAEQEQIIDQLSGARFVITEVLSPGLFDAIKILFSTTVFQICSAPFVRPFRLKRIFFTWIVPVNLFTVSWDGMVSVLRSLPEKQYEELVKRMQKKGISVNYRKMGPFWARIHVLYKET